MITSVDCTIIRFKQDLLIPHYFVYYSQSTDDLRSIAAECTGTTRSRVSRNNLGSTPIPLPPLAEQQRIVALLDEAFAGVLLSLAPKSVFPFGTALPFLHRISWDPYNESEDLISQAKKYKQEHGCYPERICADRIYINTKNRNFCTRNNIRLSGKRLGRPPRDSEINAAYKQQLSADQRKRNEAEGCFGSRKRKYSLDLIMARLPKGAENTISMAFVVMCAEKIWRLLRLFLSLFLLRFVLGNGLAASGSASETFGSL
jgi:hypothetical protein